MIQANELRIGNIVAVPYPEDISLKTFIKGKELAIVTDIFGNGSVNLVGLEFPKTNWQNMDFHEPIPLSTEILEKCGFVKEDDIFFTYVTDSMESFSLKWQVRFRDNTVTWIANMQPIKCEYLHQLQNLFWCLCGKELEVNLH